jgi:hypothetical protein
MRKYLFIAANEWNGWAGSELLWSAAAEKLARRGNEVRVSVKDWGELVPQVENLRSAGCREFLAAKGYRMEEKYTHVKATWRSVALPG